MKLAIFSPDTGGKIDGTVQAALLDHLPTTRYQNEADAVIVPVAYMPGFEFNERLDEIKKPWVLLDYCEYGWDAGDKNNLFGTGVTHQFSHLNTDGYARFDKWVADHPPVLTLKRELLLRDASARVLPCEFPCRLPVPPPQAKEQFDARPLEVFFCWGLSHPSRPRLHGDIFRNAHEHGIHVLDDFSDEGHFEKRNWAAMHVPYYRRTHNNEVMRWNRRAKLSVSMPGAGVKCFRSTMESPVSSIVAMPEDSLAWAFPWKHGVNCIRLMDGQEFSTLETVTRRFDLWEIYCRCQETVARYCSERYAKEYITPKIEASL